MASSSCVYSLLSKAQHLRDSFTDMLLIQISRKKHFGRTFGRPSSQPIQLSDNNDFASPQSRRDLRRIESYLCVWLRHKARMTHGLSE